MEVVRARARGVCRCRTEEQRSRWIDAARIPRRYDKCSFQNYYPAQGSKYYNIQLNAFKYAFTLAREYPAVDRGLLFMGPVGVGKTHLSVAILRELIEKKGTPCCLESVAAERDQNLTTISQTSESKVLRSDSERSAGADELGARSDRVGARHDIQTSTRLHDKKLTIFPTTTSTRRAEVRRRRSRPRPRAPALRLFDIARRFSWGEDYRKSLNAAAVK